MKSWDGPITRHFVTLTDRQVHYRRAGEGAPILLLHQSPRDGAELEPLMRRLAGRACVIAPDTPGFGLSDPLPLAGPGAGRIDDFAEAAAGFMAALGIARAPVYGLHTGGCIALRLALRRPDLVTGLVVDGVLLLTAEERADYLAHYLPPLVPGWDGAHLTWAWARIREQSIFFPWYRAAAETRMIRTLPPPDRMHLFVTELLSAGDHYRDAYGAALSMDVAADVARLTVPALLMSSRDDVLVTQFDRMPPLPDSALAERPENRAAAQDLAVAFLTARSGQSATPAPPPVAPLPGRTVGDYVRVGGTHLRFRMTGHGGGGPASGRPIVVLHDAAGSSAVVDHVTAGMIGHRPALAVDLPGAGDSDNPLGVGPTTVGAYADVLRGALVALGLDRVDVYGMWGGGLVGLELARQAPGRVGALALSSVMAFSDTERTDLLARYTPDFSPEPYGGHLIRAWHFLRNQGLFWPWYDETAEGALRREPFVDPGMLQRRLLGLLKAGPMYAHAYHAHFRYPVIERLREVRHPTTLWAVSGDPQYDHTARAAAEAGLPFHELPQDRTAWGRALADALSRSG